MQEKISNLLLNIKICWDEKEIPYKKLKKFYYTLHWHGILHTLTTCDHKIRIMAIICYQSEIQLLTKVWFKYKYIKRCFKHNICKSIRRSKNCPTSGTAVTLKTGRPVVPGSNPSRACRPSRSEFSVVFSETSVNTG